MLSNPNSNLLFELSQRDIAYTNLLRYLYIDTTNTCFLCIETFNWFLNPKSIQQCLKLYDPQMISKMFIEWVDFSIWWLLKLWGTFGSVKDWDNNNFRSELGFDWIHKDLLVIYCHSKRLKPNPNPKSLQKMSHFNPNPNPNTSFQ